MNRIENAYLLNSLQVHYLLAFVVLVEDKERYFQNPQAGAEEQERYLFVAALSEYIGVLVELLVAAVELDASYFHDRTYYFHYFHWLLPFEVAKLVELVLVLVYSLHYLTNSGLILRMVRKFRHSVAAEVDSFAVADQSRKSDIVVDNFALLAVAAVELLTLLAFVELEVR